jgi:hypothetical protein
VSMFPWRSVALGFSMVLGATPQSACLPSGFDVEGPQ